MEHFSRTKTLAKNFYFWGVIQKCLKLTSIVSWNPRLDRHIVFWTNSITFLMNCLALPFDLISGWSKNVSSYQTLALRWELGMSDLVSTSIEINHHQTCFCQPSRMSHFRKLPDVVCQKLLKNSRKSQKSQIFDKKCSMSGNAVI